MKLRILLSWLCVGLAFFLMWQRPHNFLFVIPLILVLLARGGFFWLPPVSRPIEDEKWRMLVLIVCISIPSLLTAYSDHPWICWLIIGAVVISGIIRDIVSPVRDEDANPGVRRDQGDSAPL